MKSKTESVIHSVLFSTKHFTPESARNWLKKHNYPKPIKRVHRTEKYLHYRLKNPISTRYRYRTIAFGKYIRAIVGFDKKVPRRRLMI